MLLTCKYLNFSALINPFSTEVGSENEWHFLSHYSECWKSVKCWHEPSRCSSPLIFPILRGKSGRHFVHSIERGNVRGTEHLLDSSEKRKCRCKITGTLCGLGLPDMRGLSAGTDHK
jgi:hypothetical protein